jgi:hypothetical protein
VLFSVVEASQCKEDSMATASFNPNRLTFEEGLKRIEEAATRAGVDRERTLTSRDDEVIRALDALEIENVPDGFKKWQLHPVSRFPVTRTTRATAYASSRAGLSRTRVAS